MTLCAFPKFSKDRQRYGILHHYFYANQGVADHPKTYLFEHRPVSAA
jgi:hypothetical protein